jgi:hypothetical protein
MKDNYRQHEYKAAQELPTRTRENYREPASYDYQRSKPYGRDTSGYDALQRLKEIAEYEEPPRSQRITTFDPTTMLNDQNGRNNVDLLYKGYYINLGCSFI